MFLLCFLFKSCFFIDWVFILLLYKYFLLDANMEEVDLDNDMSSVLGPKRLDFEVIDFDQFGVQPPDLPLSEDSKHEGKKTKLNHGMVSLHDKNVGVVLEQGWSFAYCYSVVLVYFYLMLGGKYYCI